MPGKSPKVGRPQAKWGPDGWGSPGGLEPREREGHMGLKGSRRTVKGFVLTAFLGL